MYKSLRPFLTPFLILVTVYFALVWAKILPHPGWPPGEIEPIITIISALASLGAWYEQSPIFPSNKVKDTIFVNVLDAKGNTLRKFNRDFKSTKISNHLELQFYIENAGDRVVAIKFMTVFAKTRERILFTFESIYQIKDGYPNGVTVNPTPDVLEKIEPKTSKTLRVNFSSYEDNYDLKDKLLHQQLALKITFVGGTGHSTDFMLHKWQVKQ